MTWLFKLLAAGKGSCRGKGGLLQLCTEPRNPDQLVYASSCSPGCMRLQTLEETFCSVVTLRWRVCEKVLCNKGFGLLRTMCSTAVLAAGQRGLLKHSFSISTWEFCGNPADDLRARRKHSVGGKELRFNCSYFSFTSLKKWWENFLSSSNLFLSYFKSWIETTDFSKVRASKSFHMESGSWTGVSTTAEEKSTPTSLK